MEEFEIDLENNKPKLEEKLYEPILKFAEMTKICYIGPEEKAEGYKEGKRVNDVANMVFNSAASGTLDVCSINSMNSKQDSNVNIIFYVISGKEEHKSLIKLYIKLYIKKLGFLIIDEYCSNETKEEVKELISNETIGKDTCIFVKRSEEPTGFEGTIPEENIINASNPIDVVKRLRDIADGKGLLAKDEKMPVKNEKAKKIKKLKDYGK